ncbi:MAG: radical SAM protein [Firmicutes bacterium]|nr:radical SAM protein [Bacillota bacterium]
MKGIVVPERPYHLSWDLTTACRLHCSFCYSAGGRPHPAETTELIETILDNVVELKPLHLGIGGGDPLLSPYIAELLQRLVERMRDETPIITVDTMMVNRREDLVRQVRRLNEDFGEHRIQFYLSIHGAPEVHDRIVGLKGHFEEQVEGIKLLKQYGVNFNLGIVPTRENLDQLDAMLALALRLGAGLLNISQFVPIGRGDRAYDHNLSPEQYRRLLDWIVTRNAQLRRRYIVTHEHWMAAVDQALFTSSLFVGCSAGIYYFGVRSNGDVVPCQLNPYVLGNVREARLTEIWRWHPLLQRWRERRVDGRCGDCPLLFKCGGCRCNAVAYSGDFFGEDSLCPFAAEELISLNQTGQEVNATAVNGSLSETAIRNDMWIVKLVTLATPQGDSLVIRNEPRNTFVELNGDATIIYGLVPPQYGITLGDLRAVFKERTGKELPVEELGALVRSGVLGCVAG